MSPKRIKIDIFLYLIVDGYELFDPYVLQTVFTYVLINTCIHVYVTYTHVITSSLGVDHDVGFVENENFNQRRID